jgi:hypothetical protein
MFFRRYREQTKISDCYEFTGCAALVGDFRKLHLRRIEHFIRFHTDK